MGTSATLEAQVDQLQQDNQHLKDTLEDYQKEKEEAIQRIAALESSYEENRNKVTLKAKQFTNLTANFSWLRKLMINQNFDIAGSEHGALS